MDSVATIAEALRTARAAREGWAASPARHRAEVAARWAALLLRHRERLMDQLQADTGKSRVDAFEEVAAAVLTAQYYARTAPRLLRTRRHLGLLPGLITVAVRPEPLGVAGVILPSNHPLTLLAGDCLPALVAGNAVLLNPAPQTRPISRLAAELAVEAGLPPGLWQVLAGDVELGRRLCTETDVVAFTGSAAVGAEVAAAAGAALVPCHLELGGKNAMLVLADAPVRRAARNAAQAAFAAAGQVCVGIELVYVEQAVAERFTAALVAEVQALRLGNDAGYRGRIGPLLSPGGLARTRAQVEQAVELGATVLTGGRPRPDLGPLFHEPTVLSGTRPGMAVRDQETFGPVLCLQVVPDAEEALPELAGGRLNASVWTADRRRGSALAQRIRAGSVNVNEGYAASYSSIAAPMGGFGRSGTGRRNGAEGLLRFTAPQAVATARGVLLHSLPGVGPRRWATVFTWLLKVRQLALERFILGRGRSGPA